MNIQNITKGVCKIQLFISNQVKDWIRQKGGFVTIDIFEPVNCCTAGPEVTVSLKRPKKIQYFKEYKIEDLLFYIHPHIVMSADTLEVSLKGFSIFKFLHVSGFRPFSDQVR